MLIVKSELFGIKSFVFPIKALDIFFWKLLMDQSCEDKNIISFNDKTIEICMNDVSMEDKFEKNPSAQTKASRIEKVESKELVKMNLKRLHVQRKFWNFMEEQFNVGAFIV